MTPDIKTQLESIDGQKPSLHKIDKKVSILIFQVLEILEKHNDLNGRLKCVETKQIKDGGFIKGIVAFGSVIVSALTLWVTMKK